MFGNMPGLLPHAKAGRLRALAVTTMARAAPLPDISTIGDFVPGYEASSFFGVGAPKNTPAAIVEKLNTEINAAVANPKIRTRLVNWWHSAGGSPADFGKFIAGETEKWAKVVKFAGIKAD